MKRCQFFDEKQIWDTKIFVGQMKKERVRGWVANSFLGMIFISVVCFQRLLLSLG